MSIHRLVILQTMYGQKKNFSTFSYKLVQISPIMILVNSGAFLSISSWFCELTELIFVMILYISSTGYPPKTQGIMGHVQVANTTYTPGRIYQQGTENIGTEGIEGISSSVAYTPKWIRLTSFRSDQIRIHHGYP